jgi:large subunit ribosomal protein L25
MQRVDLAVELRDKRGKGAARQIRRAGRVPAVLYGEGSSTLLSVSPSDLLKILQSESGENSLINLEIKGGQSKTNATVILRDLQRDPVTRQILHADLFEISMNKAIRLRVPLEMTGEPPGVKEGGVLQHNLRELEIECLPAVIPDHIEVDISGLEIGSIIHVRELQMIEGVKVLEDPDDAVVSVAAPISEAKLEQMLAGTPTEAETAEPEVVSKGKEIEEAEAGAPEEKATEKPKAAEKHEGKPEKK